MIQRCNVASDSLYFKSIAGHCALQGTYYGQQGGQEDAASCGFGADFANSLGAEWTTGVQTFVAMNDPQYNNSVSCGQCLMYRQVSAL